MTHIVKYEITIMLLHTTIMNKWVGAGDKCILKYIDFGILYTGTVPDTGNDYKLSNQLL
jgi:hypothetical protein